MKLKEMLANEWAEDEAEVMDTYAAHADSFLAGFKKAREMAVNIFKDSFTKWAGHQTHIALRGIEEDVALLGEEEV